GQRLEKSPVERILQDLRMEQRERLRPPGRLALVLAVFLGLNGPAFPTAHKRSPALPVGDSAAEGSMSAARDVAEAVLRCCQAARLLAAEPASAPASSASSARGALTRLTRV